MARRLAKRQRADSCTRLSAFGIARASEPLGTETKKRARGPLGWRRKARRDSNDQAFLRRSTPTPTPTNPANIRA
jgi:hypothetical protein